MAGPIRVDLDSAQQCKAVNMIEFLFAFCLSEGKNEVPVCNEESLGRAFEKVKEIAKDDGILKTELTNLLKAKKEVDMYNPFVRACNYALDALSRVNDVEGLPEVSKQMEIVFARNYEVVESGHPMWESQGQPGIVLMGWDKFKRVRDLPDETPYSQSYNGDICVSNPGPDTWFYWPEIRSTVELKITGLPKDKWTRDFEAGFKDLAELEPHISLEDPPQDVFSPEPVRMNIYGTQSSASLDAAEVPTREDEPFLSTNKKRKNRAEVSDENNTATASKRSRTGDRSHEKSSTQNEKDSGQGTPGSSVRRGIPLKHPVNVQNGIYAAERLSCSLDITHSLNFILHGSTLYMMWSDRQNVIQAGGFDILDDLPHFLLVLLIIQRFDLGRWGFFTEFENSPIHTMRECAEVSILEATFEGADPVYIFPTVDCLHGGISLDDRSTNLVGARRKTDETMDTTSSEQIEKDNDLIVKFSWPKASRVSEVTFIERAKEIGETNDLVKDHIPKMLGHMDPPYVTCSTKIIRDFLHLRTDGDRVLRVILFRRLEEIKYLNKEDMIIGFLDCFFCHWALWEQGIEQGDVSIGNLMCDPVTKRGVLNDFDLARLRVPNQVPSAEDNATGTLPFLALDLLNTPDFKGLVPRLYRHDAESFTWCLIYVCICMDVNGDGQIRTRRPHPLPSWSTSVETCFYSKFMLYGDGLLKEFPYHQETRPLVIKLYSYWMDRNANQRNQRNRKLCQDSSKSDLASDSSESLEDLLSKYSINRERAVQTMEPPREPSDGEWFKQIFKLLLKQRRVIPKSKKRVFADMVKLVAKLYPFVKGKTEGNS